MPQRLYGPALPKTGRLISSGGFRPGHIYELVYHSQDPRLVGMGFAAVRDVASYIKYNPDALFPAPQAIAFGFSQTGRFLRHFLYQGFNTDEKDRKVYDGMLIQVAGAGRGSFNHRFAQPSRDGTPYLSLFFPFTSRTERDPRTGVEDGVFVHQRQDHMPLISQSNTSYEYWGRAASLIHTAPDGLHDIPPQANERIYLLTGAQHMIEWLIPSTENRMGDSPAYRGNEVDFRLTFRALFEHMAEWVKEGKEPRPAVIQPSEPGHWFPHPDWRFHTFPA